MHCPHCRWPAGTSIAQVAQRGTRAPKRATHAWHTGRAGQASHTAHWLGSVKARRSSSAVNMGQYTFVTTDPPTIDPVAAARWQAMPRREPPWLHEEVGRRMEERLEWIRMAPRTWVDWQPLNGGIRAHARVAQRYPGSEAYVAEQRASAAKFAIESIAPRWRRWLHRLPRTHLGAPPDESAEMVWANMALHASARPQGLLAAWHRLLAPQGFLMFSCLGPDTLAELRPLYAALGWPPPAQAFTDMHDWGDMLVAAGFAEPVMDMERIELTFATPARLLEELRGLGRNLHPGRFGSLRGRGWRTRLDAELAERLGDPRQQGRLRLGFEVVYGHALKPAAAARLAPQSEVSLAEMRSMLRAAQRR